MADTVPPSTRFLHGTELYLAVTALNFANAVSFFDLIAIVWATGLATKDFNAASTIEWAFTATIIASTVGITALGYFSDVLGRKIILEAACGLQTLCSVVSIFIVYSGSAPALFTVRAFSGMASATIASLINIAQNDFLESGKRGKYQGFQGMSVAVGSIAATLVPAVIASSPINPMFGWMAVYAIQSGITIFALVLLYFLVPLNLERHPTRDELREELKRFDILGLGTGMMFIIPFLLLLCQGKDFARDQRKVFITLIVLTVVGFIAFLASGFRNRDVRYIIPFRLFRNRTVAIVLVQNVLFGWVYFDFMYFAPMYLLIVQDLPPVKAAAYLVPYFMSHGITAALSGLLVTWLGKQKCKSYYYVMLGGFATWALVMGLLGWHVRRTETSMATFIVFEILVGIGSGSVFQNSVLAIRAQVEADDNASAISCRNVVRYVGGAVGMAVNTLVLEASLRGTLPKQLHWIAETALSRDSLSKLSSADHKLVENAITGAMAKIWYICAGLLGLCFVLSVFIKETPDRSNDEAQDQSPQASSSASQASTELKELCLQSPNVSEVNLQSQEPSSEDRGPSRFLRWVSNAQAFPSPAGLVSVRPGRPLSIRGGEFMPR